MLTDFNLNDLDILTESAVFTMSADIFSKEFSKLDKAIQSSNKVYLFRHISPDKDAIGSVTALKNAIISKYNKKVFIAHEGSFFEGLTQNDLVIICDLGEVSRVAGKYTGSPKTARIDHHKTGMKCNITIESGDAGSTCELVTIFLKNYNYEISKDSADVLFKGIISDTGRMQYNLSQTTLLALAILNDCGVDYKSIYSNMYTKDPQTMNSRKYVLDNYKTTDNGLTYLVVDNNKCKSVGANPYEVSSMTSELENIKGSPIWVITTNRDGQYYSRIRSRFIDLRPIVAKYNGGGHENAVGCKVPTQKMYVSLLQDLDNAAAKAGINEDVKETVISSWSSIRDEYDENGRIKKIQKAQNISFDFCGKQVNLPIESDKDLEFDDIMYLQKVLTNKDTMTELRHKLEQFCDEDVLDDTIDIPSIAEPVKIVINDGFKIICNYRYSENGISIKFNQSNTDIQISRL